MQTSRGQVSFGAPPQAPRREWRSAPASGASTSSTASGRCSFHHRPRARARRRWGSLLAAAALATGAAPGGAAAAQRPVSSHAMVYSCCMPVPLQQRIFDESRALKASYVRVDVEVDGIYGGLFDGPEPDWSKLDQTLAIARQRSRPGVLGVLVGTPGSLATSCDREPWFCPPKDPAAYAERVERIVRHARKTISTWELVNEPCYFTGIGANAYARLLRLVHRAVKRADRRARLVIGDSVAGCGSTRWLDRVLRLAPHSFEIANLHLRGSVRGVARELRRRRAIYARHGRGSAPVWVTEFGYSSSTACQSDAGYRGGERAQARYLAAGLRALTKAGAAQVFVTLRDNLDGCWQSEGIDRISTEWPFGAERKRAFKTVARWRR
jgi:hypothetical protein